MRSFFRIPLYLSLVGAALGAVDLNSGDVAYAEVSGQPFANDYNYSVYHYKASANCYELVFSQGPYDVPPISAVVGTTTTDVYVQTTGTLTLGATSAYSYSNPSLNQGVGGNGFTIDFVQNRSYSAFAPFDAYPSSIYRTDCIPTATTSCGSEEILFNGVYSSNGQPDMNLIQQIKICDLHKPDGSIIKATQGVENLVYWLESVTIYQARQNATGIITDTRKAIYQGNSNYPTDFAVTDVGATLFVALSSGAIVQKNLNTGAQSTFLTVSSGVSQINVFRTNTIYYDSNGVTYKVSRNGGSPTPAVPASAKYCPAPTTAPTTKAPTTKAPTTKAPTTAAPTTKAPTTKAPTTKAPTTAAPTTKAPSRCYVTFSSTADSTWQSEGKTYTQARVTITNTGKDTYNTLSFSAGSAASRIMNPWGVSQDAQGNFVPKSYAFPLAPGKTFQFGYQITGADAVFTPVSC